MSSIPEPKAENLAETSDYVAWRIEEPDGEVTYHLQLNNVTIHFFHEEWDQFLELINILVED
jgi:protein-tyrosine phosphatase